MDKKEKDLNFIEIGARIRAERERLNLTREKLAEIIGLSPFYIGQIERGDRKMSVDTLVKISNSLHVSVDYILKGCKKSNEELDLQKEFHVLENSEENYNKALDEDIKELLNILQRCSKTEINLIKDMTKLIVPYLKNR
ncbi:helix-turn-helix transcriptional regulator [Anaerosalibacter bizertensis]|uniref:Helix-turn-helix transcriptional regulator n=1 Tax=Anaerosalibacter bizertensis TaxID=932217 RepID=A0A844FHL5_9FIRM|nr:helix-turn-helix transcriptional regulator [Anaerosalibacter bizertensis]MBV1817971.1 helix-turn-helix transcriptional regulator [Bacteroidales bacterium MSK.15.36]MBU5294628.1 helix-turn-helix transcriptional regulator [Anaerosalibacter bizertensis]MCB5558945.1 helix-turn-helix transcriptional regulator [Anaerosalibacter bizertensis]MCG4565226.1 helix-turn-helix transcriptional regulator [Anaerosalibacter bizertensis]MCG4581982.1 helix-turn-helix transcriptional regulator [Anaerosalibacter